MLGKHVQWAVGLIGTIGSIALYLMVVSWGLPEAIHLTRLSHQLHSVRLHTLGHNTTGIGITGHSVTDSSNATGRSNSPADMAESSQSWLALVVSRYQCGQVNTPSCPVCPAIAQRCGKQRVRRNFIMLPDNIRRSILTAIDTIKTTSWAEGLVTYGPKFKTYDYFVQRHAQAQTDPLSDRAHGGSWFVAYHRLFVLEFEEVLLAINPSIEALPYWDIAEGFAEVLGDGELEFGSMVGTGEDYRVIDGYFGGWRINKLNQTLATVAGNDGYYSGNAKGELRTERNNPRTNGITRYPVCEGPSLTKLDFNRCAALVSSSIDEYMECLSEFRTPYHGSLHSEAHMWLGSRVPPEDPSCTPLDGSAAEDSSMPVLGDFFDVTTSVNDPIWMLHHANIDRAAFHFQHTNKQHAGTYHSYRAATGSGMWFELYGPAAMKGLLLLDVITPRQPFRGSDLGFDRIGGPVGELTVADSFCWANPSSGLYTYDTVVATACSGDAG